MMTVKELAGRTGISVRTLHYYDEIGLLSPTVKSGAGYRLYDEKDLEALQQILFFREFDVPLKEIQSILRAPELERNQILRMQRKLLAAKKERLERLISSLDTILEGENPMDFTIFSKAELSELFQTMFGRMPEPIRQNSIREFGGVEQWKDRYIAALSSEAMQQQYAKVVEWYGGKEEYLSAVKNPISKEEAERCKDQLEELQQKLIQERRRGPGSPEVRRLIGAYALIMKTVAQTREEEGPMLAQARFYRDQRTRQAVDGRYGDGAAEFFAQAIEAFYRR